MPRRLAKVTSSWTAARTWATEPGAEFDVVDPEGLDRVDDGEGRALGLEGGQDVAKVRFGGELQRGLFESEAGGAEADLGGGLLARDVDGGGAAAGEGGGGLEEEGRLADAGIAADEDRRSRHEAAAERAVELGDAGEGARRLRLRGGEVAEDDAAAARRSEGAAGGAFGEARFLDDRVPRAAGVAAAGPLRVGGATGGAGEGGAAGAHGAPFGDARQAGRPFPASATRRVARAGVIGQTRSGLRRGRG